jgi:hypothetical protein
MPKNTLNVISKTITKEGQTTDFHELIELVDSENYLLRFRCLIEIHTDSVVSQSRVSIKVWSQDDLRWNLLHSIKPMAMKTKPSLSYLPEDPKHKDYQADRNELIRVAKKILNLS